ncbi:ABC transporter permease [Streptomyces sp. NPDC004539]|uniref:ABC transporter permease n=1 Tax=Streptomyces sp. NPDC004539 TaxID=3154280 RepID=UPI0033A20DC0
MSTLTAPPATAAQPRAAGPRRFASVVALARFEARELALQIPVAAVTVLWIVLTVLRLTREEGMDDFPVLFMADRDTQDFPQLLALAVLISVNTGVLRGHRDKTVEQFSMLPLEPWRRTLGHVLSIVPFALFTAVAVGVDFAFSALKPGAVGSGSVGELLVGPLTVMFAGIIGILLAGLWPLTLVPVMLAVVAYLTLVGSVALTGDWSQWFSPVVGDTGGGIPNPSNLLGRPAGWHALYLAALCVLLACVALLVKGGRTTALKAAAVLALAVTVAAAFGQRPVDGTALAEARRTVSEHPEKVQSCEERGGSTYCSFPEWNGQRARWAQVVDRVRAASGSTAPLTVRQRIDVTGGIERDAALEPQTGAGQVTIGTRWGGNHVPEFAVGVASVLVAGTEGAASENLCGARGVTVMWLTLAGDPTPEDTFKALRIDDSNVGSGIVRAPTDSFGLTARQTDVVNSVLDRPAAEVTAAVKAHWSELTSPRTTTADAARLLGVEVPKGADTCNEH